MRRSLALTLSFAVSLVLPAQPAPGQELNTDIRRIITLSPVSNLAVGVSVVDCDGGEVLGESKPDEKLMPASNMKLLTTGAALEILGAEFQFTTEVLLDGDRVIIRGDGDPALADPEILSRMSPKLSVEDVLGMWVEEIKKAGANVREVVIDDRVFDRELLHPTWAAENYQRPWSAEVSGLNFHANVLKVFATPRKDTPQTPPAVRLEPEAPFVQIVNRARSGDQSKNALRLTRETLPDAPNRLTLAGEVGAVDEEPVTIHGTAEFTGKLLADRLARAGVSGAPSVRVADAGEDLSKARVLAKVQTPLTQVLKRCNTFSENLYAECLLKRMGHQVTHEPGSWNNGTAVLRMALAQRLGPDAAAGTTVVDGSGLSRDNLVTPAVFTRWLDAMSKRPFASQFMDSLAEPGHAGTLEKRFRDKRLVNALRAKSGYINGVRCLAGYLVHKKTGRRVAFSVMVNGISKDAQTQAARELHEEIVLRADAWLAAHPGVPPEKKGG